MSTTCMPGAYKGQMRASDPLLFGIIDSYCQEGARNQIQVLCKTASCLKFTEPSFYYPQKVFNTGTIFYTLSLYFDF